MRKRRVRAKITGTEDRPRLSVFRSNRYIYAQLIDDVSKKTLLFVSEKELEGPVSAPLSGAPARQGKKTDRSFKIGELIAEKAKKNKITTVVFDRNGYLYHGRVKALADGARKGGLKF